MPSLVSRNRMWAILIVALSSLLFLVASDSSRPAPVNQSNIAEFTQKREKALSAYNSGDMRQAERDLRDCFILIRKFSLPGEFRARIHLDFLRLNSTTDAAIGYIEMAEAALSSASDSKTHEDVLQELAAIYESASVKDKEAKYRQQLVELRRRRKERKVEPKPK